MGIVQLYKNWIRLGCDACTYVDSSPAFVDRRKETVEEKETFVLGGLILQFPFETGVRGDRVWYLSLMAVMDSVVWYPRSAQNATP